LVRRHDRDRFQTVLFAPAARREALFALYAFNYEIARVRERVSEPTLGRIRLEWWRETVAAAYEGAAVRRHVVVEPLTAAIREHALTREHFDRLIDARDPAAYQAGRHVGIAYALAGLLRAMPFRTRPDRCLVPPEIAAAASRHLDLARALRPGPARAALPALLPAIVAGRFLTRLKRAGHDPFHPALAPPDPLQSWRLAAAALFNRF
jgi:NADH dehydrogenase [ubiquinone] 1 alpha subcomplex assembly factor 6